MGLHSSHVPILKEIPFGKTIIRIETTRANIDKLRESPMPEPSLRDELQRLEEELRSAYAQLAAEAAAKVARWKRGPRAKGDRPKRAR